MLESLICSSYSWIMFNSIKISVIVISEIRLSLLVNDFVDRLGNVFPWLNHALNSCICLVMEVYNHILIFHNYFTGIRTFTIQLLISTIPISIPKLINISPCSAVHASSRNSWLCLTYQSNYLDHITILTWPLWNSILLHILRRDKHTKIYMLFIPKINFHFQDTH